MKSQKKIDITQLLLQLQWLVLTKLMRCCVVLVMLTDNERGSNEKKYAEFFVHSILDNVKYKSLKNYIKKMDGLSCSRVVTGIAWMYWSSNECCLHWLVAIYDRCYWSTALRVMLLLEQRYERNSQIGSVVDEQFQLLLHVNIEWLEGKLTLVFTMKLYSG